MPSQIDVTKPVFGTPTTQSVRDNFTTAANEITLLQEQTNLAPFLPLSGGRMQGPMYLYNDPTDAMMPATKGYVDAGGGGGGGGIPEAPPDSQYYGRQNGSWQPVLPLVGGTLTGILTLSADPVNSLDAATKEYVDNATKIKADAPSDGTYYGRMNGTWANVPGLTGGRLTGSLAVNIAIPTTPPPDPSVAAISLYSGVAVVQTELTINAYRSGAAAYSRLASGVAGGINLGSGGTINLAAAATGAAGAAITFGPPLALDYRGSITWGGATAVPTDSVSPMLSGAMYSVTASGYFTFNAYLGGGSVWKYLATGYAGLFSQSPSDGTVVLQLAASGSAGGVLPSATPFVFSPSGQFQAQTINVTNGLLQVTSAGPCLQFLRPGVVWLGIKSQDSGGLRSLLFGQTDGNGNITQNYFSMDQNGGAWATANMFICTSVFGAGFWLGAAPGNFPSIYLTSSYRISFNGSITSLFYIRGDGYTLMQIDASGNLTIPGSVFAANVSDARTKRNVEPYTRGLADLIQLNPISFEFNGEGGTTDDGKIRHGLSAQDAQPFIPECVYPTHKLPSLQDDPPPPDVHLPGQLSLDPAPLTYAIINALKEIANRLAALEGTHP